VLESALRLQDGALMDSRKPDRGMAALGSDHAGYRLKEALKDELVKTGFRVLDTGTHSEEPCDYPDFGVRVAEAVSSGDADLGVLVCGTGIGMGMVANKVPGVRAAVCNDVQCAESGRSHNDANIITMGARVVSDRDARRILKAFLDTPYEGKGEGGARHARRLEKIRDIERRYTGRKDGN